MFKYFFTNKIVMINVRICNIQLYIIFNIKYLSKNKLHKIKLKF